MYDVFIFFNTSNGINDKSIEEIADGLTKNNTITSLDLSHTSTSFFPLIYCLFIVSFPWTFVHNNFGKEGVSKLCHSLARNCSIRKLNVSVTNNAYPFPVSGKLSVFSRIDNKIGSDGLTVIGQLLGINKSLTHLSLESKIGISLSLSLCCFSLRLSMCLFIDTGVRYNELSIIKKGLETNTTLTELDLS